MKVKEDLERRRRADTKASPRPIYRDDAFYLHSIHLLSLAPMNPEVRSRRAVDIVSSVNVCLYSYFYCVS